MPTREQARDTMYEHAESAWRAFSATAQWPLYADDLNGVDPKGKPYGMVTLQHNINPRKTMGSPAIYESKGNLYVAIYTPAGNRNKAADSIAQRLIDTLRVNPANGCVRFENPVASEKGRDGNYFLTLVKCDFEYEEEVGTL